MRATKASPRVRHVDEGDYHDTVGATGSLPSSGQGRGDRDRLHRDRALLLARAPARPALPGRAHPPGPGVGAGHRPRAADRFGSAADRRVRRHRRVQRRHRPCDAADPPGAAGRLAGRHHELGAAGHRRQLPAAVRLPDRGGGRPARLDRRAPARRRRHGLRAPGLRQRQGLPEPHADPARDGEVGGLAGDQRRAGDLVHRRHQGAHRAGGGRQRARRRPRPGRDGRRRHRLRRLPGRAPARSPRSPSGPAS